MVQSLGAGNRYTILFPLCEIGVICGSPLIFGLPIRSKYARASYKGRTKSILILTGRFSRLYWIIPEAAPIQIREQA
jgi:hypothetical protein